MYKFLYFGKWYCSGLSLDEITRAHDNGGELWAYELKYYGKKLGTRPSIIASVLSADKISNIQAMK